MPHPTPASSRIDGIDCLRALAILYVLMNHVNMRLIFTSLHYLKAIPKPLSAALVWQGQAGVQIFFAVSGFLITSTSIRRWGSLSTLRIRQFYLLRFARIAPLLLTLLAILSLLHALHVHNYVVSQKVGGLKAALIAALTLRVGLLEATRGYLPGNWDILWSLSVEELFYLVFPLVCRIPNCRLLRRRIALIALLVVFVVLGPFGRTLLTHGDETWQEYSYLGGMDAIALGCLTALFLSTRTLTRRTLLTFTALGSAILVFCLGFSRLLEPLDRTGLGMSLLAVGACLLIAAATQTRWRAPRLFAPFLAYGRRSYEIYLTHMFLVFLCFDTFMKLNTPTHPLRLIPLLFLITIVLAGVLGELVARLFSEPANRYLRTRFTPSGSVPPPVADPPLAE